MDVVEAKFDERDNLDDPIVSEVMSDLEIEGFNVISIVVEDEKGILVDSTVSVIFPMFEVQSLSVVLALEAEV